MEDVQWLESDPLLLAVFDLLPSCLGVSAKLSTLPLTSTVRLPHMASIFDRGAEIVLERARSSECHTLWIFRYELNYE